MEKQKLENFRLNDFGNTAFFLATSPPLSVLFNYDSQATHAFRFNVQCIRDLENSLEYLNPGIDTIPAINMWYNSIDSFVNTLLQLFCLRNGDDFEMVSLDPLNTKYEYLLSRMGLEILEREKNLTLLLGDLVHLETWIRRDFVNGVAPVYKKANFSSRSLLLNQVDVMQCMLIAFEVFQSFRFCITGLDLMPNISLEVSNMIVYEKLDLLIRSIIIPAFKDILAKQMLTIDLDLDTKFDTYPLTPIFKEGEIVVISRVIQNEIFKRDHSTGSTNIIAGLFERYKKKFVGKEHLFNRHYIAPGYNMFAKKK